MASSPLYPSDLVRIVRLEAEQREVDGSTHPPPQPRVGETGTIVEEVDNGIYLVERCTDDGRTIWVAEFMAGEIELLDSRALRTED